MTYEEYISQFEVFEGFYKSRKRKKGYHRHHIVPRSQQNGEDTRQVYLLPSQHLWAHILYDIEYGTKTADFLLVSSHLKRENIHCYEDCLSYDSIDEKKRKADSKRMNGKNNPMYGRTHTDDVKELISKLRTGTHMDDETKKKVSENSNWKGTKGPMNGKHHTEESLEKISKASKAVWENPDFRQKMSDLRKGENNGMYGRHRTDEEKKVLAEIRLGTHWWNNGEVSRQSVECPGEGWVKGRVKRTA